LNRRTPARTDLESVAFDRAWLPSRGHFDKLGNIIKIRSAAAPSSLIGSQVASCVSVRPILRALDSDLANLRRGGLHFTTSYHLGIVKPKRIRDCRRYTRSGRARGNSAITTMEGHHQHTSPFPPEFRTTHNFFTKEVFVFPSTHTFLHQNERSRFPWDS
jgi:hypothetical protein